VHLPWPEHGESEVSRTKGDSWYQQNLFVKERKRKGRREERPVIRWGAQDVLISDLR